MSERCLDRQIVEYCIRNRLIYEAAIDNSVVFVGYDANHLPKYATTRSTNGDVKKEVYGSNKAHCFSITNTRCDRLHAFESAIDLLSYMTLLKRSHRDYLTDNYLSIGGATTIGTSIKDSTVPIALETFLSDYPNIKSIHLHLDNDKAGRDTVSKILYHYENQYMIKDEHPLKFKDFNELLKSKIKKINSSSIVFISYL